MSDDKQPTSELGAVGASGAIGIMPDGFFAQLLREAETAAVPPSASPPPAVAVDAEPLTDVRKTLSDRG